MLIALERGEGGADVAQHADKVAKHAISQSQRKRSGLVLLASTATDREARHRAIPLIVQFIAP